MQPDQFRNVMFDDQIESYSPFYDHQWAQELNKLAEPAKKLGELLFDLMLSLKGISRAQSLPQIAVDSTNKFWSGYQLGRLQDSDIVKIVNYVAERLDQKLVFAGVEKSELKKAIVDLAVEVLEKTNVPPVEFARQVLWDAMVKMIPDDPDASAKNELRVGIRSFLPICYSGLFFAYEDFVASCVHVCHAGSGKKPRVTTDEFKTEFKKWFGDNLADDCWFTNQRIIAARTIRNALAHAGGKETPDLKALRPKHGIAVIDERLQILPLDVVQLYELIKPKITSLVQCAATLSAFT